MFHLRKPWKCTNYSPSLISADSQNSFKHHNYSLRIISTYSRNSFCMIPQLNCMHCLLFVNHTRPHMKSHACYTTLSFHTTVTAIYCTWFSTVFILGYLNLVLEFHSVRKMPPSLTKFSITLYLTLNRFINIFFVNRIPLIMFPELLHHT